jgi:hypothetical protein
MSDQSPDETRAGGLPEQDAAHAYDTGTSADWDATDHGGEPASTVEGPPYDGLIDAAVSVVTDPVATFRHLTRDPRVGWAVIVIAVSSALGWAVSAAQLTAGDAFGGEFTEFQDDFGFNLSEYRGVAVLGGLVGGPIFGLISAAVAAGILHLIARMLSGEGTYEGMFVGLGFASIPQLLAVPFQLLANVGTGGQLVASTISFGVAIWSLLLLGIAIRESNRFSTGRAVATLVIPIGAFVVLMILLVIFLVALFVGQL